MRKVAKAVTRVVLRGDMIDMEYGLCDEEVEQE